MCILHLATRQPAQHDICTLSCSLVEMLELFCLDMWGAAVKEPGSLVLLLAGEPEVTCELE